MAPISSRGRGVALAVFLLAFVYLAWGAAAPGLATAWVDPVSRIQAQDETVYGSIALNMARGDSGWLTPEFAGRLALFKPPLHYWFSAIAATLFGESPFALRLTSLLAGAGTVTVVFFWLWRGSSLLAAFTGAILLISSHLFFVLSRTGLLDSLLTFETILAAYVLWRDPRLEQRTTPWIFGAATGAALMTKGAAGLFGWLALAVLVIALKERRAWSQIALAVGVAVAIALPWHVYQLATHPHWFWAEYVLTEHLEWGLKAPGQTSDEWQPLFYLTRLFRLDPVLVGLALLALVRTRPKVPLTFAAVIAVAMLVYQYRNATYLMPLYPLLAIIAADAIPEKLAKPAVVVAIGLFVAKMAMSTSTWGLPFEPETTNLSYAQLEGYAESHRPNDLFVVEPDDQFYSQTLRLSKVRYVYLTPEPSKNRLPIDFHYLGIQVTATEFERLPALIPTFLEHLRSFDLDSTRPIATVILATREQEIMDLIANHPEADFYLPAGFAASGGRPARVGVERLFVLAESKK
jgi:hypothetical protein